MKCRSRHLPSAGAGPLHLLYKEPVTQAVLDRYLDRGDWPPLVKAAVEAGRAIGSDQACSPEVGCLLQTLAAHRPGGRLGEIGTACGVGAAWLASGMDHLSSLVTVEREADRVAAATRALGDCPAVTLLQGDHILIAAHGPFDLLFVDGGLDKADTDSVLALLSPGGMAVFDDLTPEAQWSAEMRAKYPAGDPVRTAWAATQAAVSTEVLTAPSEAVLLVVRPSS
jgi:predicted O-methyltransferase YrrM